MILNIESSFGVRNHPVLNKLRIEMINYDTIKSLLNCVLDFINNSLT